MHINAKVSRDIPDWVKLAIADAIMLFSRLEQEVIEIAWLIKGAEQKMERLKVARNPATDNFSDIIAIIEEAAGQEVTALADTFDDLAKDRNLIVHGAWWIVDDHRPLVVWHKFIEDNESVMSEYYLRERFADFMMKASLLLDMCRKFHDDIEKVTGIKTSALRGA
jgi:phosphoenolpyruvate-protein kinase (PTS system EI component)